MVLVPIHIYVAIIPSEITAIQLTVNLKRFCILGLTSPVLDRDRKVSHIGVIEETNFQHYEEHLKEIRTTAGTRRGLARKQTPLERGWTGNTPQGRKFGKPVTPNMEMDYNDFDSILIEYR